MMWHFCGYEFLEGIFHIFISQAVDQRIQHGVDNCVEHRGHFDSLPRVFGVGHTIEGEYGSVEDGDGGQVGGTGREGFAASTGRTDL